MSEFDEILSETPNFDIDNIINDQNSIKSNYDKLKQDLNAIRDKNTIQLIDRSNCELIKLDGDIFHGFYQLTALDLSHNLLPCLARDVFEQLSNLQVVNLSHNLITELEDFVFSNNLQLRKINLSRNLLKKINSNAFDNLNSLRKLDLSYNRITFIDKECLNTLSLEELNLNNNYIAFMDQFSFVFLENLIHLYLSNNRIKEIKETMFRTTRNIETLNFSNNLFQKLHKYTFAYLHNLKDVDFSNNSLVALGACFEYKPMLIKLNLLNNPLSKYWIKDLSISKNIRILKLTISEWMYGMDKFKKFELLSDLELHVKSEKKFFVHQYVMSHINVLTIRKLYIVIQRGIFNKCHNISKFVNLEFLHIEFLEPNNQFPEFDIGFHINKLPKLNHLALININKLIITNDNNIKYNNLTYLDLTGIDNESVDFLRNNFVMLEHLNLSFSHVDSISRGLMSTLPNLKFLNMNGTMISVIVDNLFQYNSNLEVLFLQDCQITTIGENAFRNLVNLKEIDLRGNTQLRITQSLLNGISKSAIVFFD